MISLRQGATRLAVVFVMVAALVLGSGALWAAPAPSDGHAENHSLQQLTEWLGLIISGPGGDEPRAIGRQDGCTIDPDGAQCTSTGGPKAALPVRSLEGKPWLGICDFFGGFGCSARPER